MDLGCHRVSLLEPVEKASGSVRLMSETLGVLEPIAEALDRYPGEPAMAQVAVSEMVACELGYEEPRQTHLRHRPMAYSAGVAQYYSVTGWSENWMVCHVQLQTHHCSCCCGPMLPLVLRDSQVHPEYSQAPLLELLLQELFLLRLQFLLLLSLVLWSAALGCCCNQESPGRWGQI